MSSTYRKKLIEVVQPLYAANAESARELSIRPGALRLERECQPPAAC